MAVSVEVSVVSAIAASGARSVSNRLISSAAKCCASAADPPLPQASALPPALSAAASIAPAFATGSPSAAAAVRLRSALSAKWAATRPTRPASAACMPREFYTARGLLGTLHGDEARQDAETRDRHRRHAVRGLAFPRRAQARRQGAAQG